MALNLRRHTWGLWILPLLLLRKVDISGTACPTSALPGACSSAVSPVDSSSENELPLSAGTCDFSEDLCQYVQGCRDPSISNWSAKDGWAEVLQRTYCSESYSVLQSPLLNFDTPACVEVFFNAFLPASLDVFLVLKNGTVVLVYAERRGSRPSRPLQFTLEPPQSAKLKFRARGGGGSTVGQYSIRLDYININQGKCEKLACTFDDDFCGWSVYMWNRTLSIGNLNAFSGAFAYVATTLVQAQMTTTLTTSSHSTDCVEFLYIVTGSNATLSVGMRPLNRPRVQLWSITSYWRKSNQSWTWAAIPVVSSVAFQIDFKSNSNDPQAIIAVDAVTHTRNVPRCLFLPESVGPDHHLVTNPHPVFPTTQSGSGGQQTTDPSPASATATKSLHNTAAIAGSVAAVVVVVVIIIIGVVMWRKRKSNRGDTNKQPSLETEHTSVSEDNRPTGEVEMTGGVSAETQYEHLGERSPPSNYSPLEMKASTAESTPSYYNVRRDTDLYLSPVSYNTTGKGLYENIG